MKWFHSFITWLRAVFGATGRAAKGIARQADAMKKAGAAMQHLTDAAKETSRVTPDVISPYIATPRFTAKDVGREYSLRLECALACLPDGRCGYCLAQPGEEHAKRCRFHRDERLITVARSVGSGKRIHTEAKRIPRGSFKLMMMWRDGWHLCPKKVWRRARRRA